MSLSNILRGFFIGIANIIPGVSGGTLALMLGVYERLLNAVSNVKLSTLKAFYLGRDAIRAELKKTDAAFLASIALGAGIAIIIFARVMTWLLNNYHDPTYGFFFGLVAASVIIPFKQISKINFSGIIAFVIAVLLVVGMSVKMSGENRLKAEQKKAAVKSELVVNSAESAKYERTDAASNLFLFISGVLAICAMILPGISGSFLLLLMGVYFDILLCINRFKVVPLAFFSAGALFGLLGFSRFLKYLLKKYKNPTMCFLTGLVVGSLYAIWPFKSFVMLGGKRKDLSNIWPEGLTTNEWAVIASAAVGCAVIAVFRAFESKAAAKTAPKN